ncbi:auxin-responsive GH3 family protein [Striga asiatica]|uniref:Auxin-responsive GH3 family protein n=1 Tax=Striga asiatica TaxID=4170 RepID=A0A5A7QMK3_STRAF|nr:auxin-responsive GH3 family protein [Striga asiatica]
MAASGSDWTPIPPRWHQGRLGVACLTREREDVPQSPINVKEVDPYEHKQAATECEQSQEDGINSIELGILYDFRSDRTKLRLDIIDPNSRSLTNGRGPRPLSAEMPIAPTEIRVVGLEGSFKGPGFEPIFPEPSEITSYSTPRCIKKESGRYSTSCQSSTLARFDIAK